MHRRGFLGAILGAITMPWWPKPILPPPAPAVVPHNLWWLTDKGPFYFRVSNDPEFAFGFSGFTRDEAVKVGLEGEWDQAIEETKEGA